MNKGNTIVVVLVLALILGIGGYFAYTKYANKTSNYNSPDYNSEATPSYNENTTTTASEITLNITSPNPGTKLTSTNLTVTGKTSAFAEVFVNDKETKADANGNFSLSLTLEEGENEIVVIANDESGNFAEQSFTVTVETF